MGTHQDIASSGKHRKGQTFQIEPSYNGILWITKTGALWRDLPEQFGSWQPVYSRFRLWSKSEVFKGLFENLSADADMQDASIDSTSCKVNQHAAGEKKAKNSEANQNTGLSRGWRNTKIHAVVDALGNPVTLYLSSGKINDCAVAVHVLKDVALYGSVLMLWHCRYLRLRRIAGRFVLYTAEREYGKYVGMRFLPIQRTSPGRRFFQQTQTVPARCHPI